MSHKMSNKRTTNKESNPGKLYFLHVEHKTLTPPIKSERDKKEYKVIQLENGLTACIIADIVPPEDQLSNKSKKSDSERDEELDEESSFEGVERELRNEMPEVKQKMAAAALCVSVGSFSDPPDFPGLAHFLEHMVFMGSEKYPNENDFDQYITKRGGYNDATTDYETTKFFFECLETYLDRSLDRFAQFFISPLMKKDSMSKEREIIESEFQTAIPVDDNRKEQLLASFFNPKVPVNQFSWGNLKSLKDNISDDVLYTKLYEFRKRHYSAHRMTLCIQAPLPLETLENYVTNLFKTVPSNKLPAVDFKQYSDIIYDTPDFNKIYYINPVEDILKLDLTWALPSLKHLYKSKPHQYISWLLGDEGKGSLISYLRQKVWAIGIDTGDEETSSKYSSMYAYFTITITLTNAGLDHIMEVITLVFSYINLLKKLGPQERFFKELQLIHGNSFTFADEQSSLDMVKSLSENMQFYPSEHYLTGSKLYFEYKPEDIEMVLNLLRPEKVNLMIFNKKLPGDMQFNQIEPWFNTSYTTKDIPNAYLAKWTNVEPLEEFSLPEPNKFLTTNFSILPHINDNPEYPTKIMSSDVAELWYRFDEKFNTPTAFYYYYFISPLPLESPLNSCLLDMFIGLLEIQLTEEAYPAEVADLTHTIESDDRGIFLKISGYNENLPILLELITRYITDFRKNLTVEMFEAIKSEQKMSYYNTFLDPSSLSEDLMSSLTISVYWSSIEKYNAISEVTFDMMQSFADNFIKHLYIQGLIQGNLDSQTAITATQKMIDELGCEPIIASTYPHIRVVQLPIGTRCCKIKSFNKNDTNSYITNYYQAGPFNIRMSIIIDLIMMIIEEPLFDILRTKMQLGYDVSCDFEDTIGILGYSITVNTQAGKYSTREVDVHIEAFIKHAQIILKKLPEKEFIQFKKDLIKNKQCSDVILKDEVDRNFNEITNRDYMFDRLKQEIKAIKEIDISDVKQVWDENTICGSRNNCRKLSIQVVGYGDKEAELPNVAFDSDIPDSEHNEYKLSFIETMDNQSNPRNPVNYFISCAEDFKHDLNLYPAKS